ncbi:MAG TPA: TIGR03905 family TSCPD domain-containing protein [Bacillota bacterium]|nr:TIGR03905 family TSCPD domain-containing protein [Clostridiales bacterium]HPT85325.1 TIGR03905 family TSCPD domain-containing protein [Bacillota bacterium]
MEKFRYVPRGVCSREIEISIADDGKTIEKVQFTGGCNGNTRGLASLCSGMKIGEVIKKLDGITCGQKNTSCPNELASALKAYLAKKGEAEA